MLEKGIPAVKYNFSNDMKKNVIIRLVNNRTALKHTRVSDPNDTNPPNKFKKLFNLKSTVAPLKGFYALVFGGNTFSFKRHKTKLFAEIDKKKKEMQ